MSIHENQPVLTAGAPLGQGAAVMIMSHGRGAGPHDILSLGSTLERPAFTYLAPTAMNNVWYPQTFLSPIEKNEPALSSALGVIGRLIDEAEAFGIPRTRIVLLGFSQGACLSGEFVVRRATRYGGVVMLSGGLIGAPGTTWDYGGSLDNTPVFLGCSDVDQHIPKARVDESADVLTRLHADVTKRIYPGMGHIVNHDEIAETRAIMDRVLAASAQVPL
jgi:predicted esterase